MQIDAGRVAGVNENLANLLLAAKFGVPVCPHAGGVGLCEIVQHLSMFDYVALSGTTEGRKIEWIDHLHEHFATLAQVAGGRYRASRRTGRPPETGGVAGRVRLPVGPGLARREDLTRELLAFHPRPAHVRRAPLAGLYAPVSAKAAAGTLAGLGRGHPGRWRCTTAPGSPSGGSGRSW